MSTFPTANDIKQSRFMTKDDVGEDGCICTIERFEKVNAAPSGEDPDYKWSMHVTGTDVTGQPLKPLILNSTNWAAIERGYGKDASQWVGKRIKTYNDPNVSYAGRLTGGVRVRVPSGTVAPGRTPRSEDDINRDLDDAQPPF